MIDRKLYEYLVEHLYYELSMLRETAVQIGPEETQRDKVVRRNALIESFTIHGRGLALFLYPEHGGRRRGNPVTSYHYVDDVAKWQRTRGKIPSHLKMLIERTAKEIAHLTFDRHPAGSPAKRWSPDSIIRAFSGPLRRFAARVPSGHMDESVFAIIREWPDAEPSRVLGIVAHHATVDATTERLSAHTDVSTTSPIPRAQVFRMRGKGMANDRRRLRAPIKR